MTWRDTRPRGTRPRDTRPRGTRCLCVLLAALLLAAFSGCGGDPAGRPSSPTPAPTAVATAAPTAPAATTPPTAPPAITPSPTPTGEPDPAGETAPPESPPPAAGADDGLLSVPYHGETKLLEAGRQRYALRESPPLTFTLVVPVEGVTAAYVDNAWRFTLDAEPDAAFLELSLISGADADSLLPSLMDAYLDFTDIEFSTAAAIGAESLPTGTVTASSGERLVRAWLADVEGGALCAVLDTALASPGEAAATLEAMLNRFALEK